MSALDLGYWLLGMSLDKRFGGPMRVETFIRLGIGIAIAAFHTRGVASRPHREARDRFLVREEVRHETETRVARPRR